MSLKKSFLALCLSSFFVTVFAQAQMTYWVTVNKTPDKQGNYTYMNNYKDVSHGGSGITVTYDGCSDTKCVYKLDFKATGPSTAWFTIGLDNTHYCQFSFWSDVTAGLYLRPAPTCVNNGYTNYNQDSQFNYSLRMY